MTKFLGLFDVVPGWLWACAVALLGVSCLLLDGQRAGARTEAAEARASLLSVQVSSRDAILAEQRRARLAEAPLIQVVEEANDAVRKAREDLSAVAAASDERMRKFASPVRVCRSDAGAGSGPAKGAAGGGGQGAELRALDGGNLLIVDEQARAESARLAAHANLIRDALKECVKGWAAAHVATKQDAVPAGP